MLGEVKPELHQSMVEVGTKVCHTPPRCEGELVRLRRLVMDLAAKKGLGDRGRGSHPFSSWMEQEITPLERYIGVKEDLQDLAQQLLIFGTHVHIGIEDREFLIDAMNVSRYLLPHVLALSTSSPFWMGRNTGLKCYRSIVFRHFPRTGMPRTPAVLGASSRDWWTRWSGPTASPTRRRSGGTCGRAGVTRRSSSGSATSAPGWTRRCASRRSSRRSSRKLWKLRRDNLTFRQSTRRR